MVERKREEGSGGRAKVDFARHASLLMVGHPLVLIGPVYTDSPRPSSAASSSTRAFLLPLTAVLSLALYPMSMSPRPPTDDLSTQASIKLTMNFCNSSRRIENHQHFLSPIVCLRQDSFRHTPVVIAVALLPCRSCSLGSSLAQP